MHSDAPPHRRVAELLTADSRNKLQRHPERSPVPRPHPLPLLALAAACGVGEPRTGLGNPTVDTLAGGAVRVANHAPTLWSDTSGWRLVPERVIAPAEGSPGELGDVTRLVADAAGNAFVMQILPSVIKAFGPDGTWLRDIGRAGDGPGEFRDGMLALRGDTLVIQDPNNQRLTLYRTDGTLLGTARSQCCFFSSSMPLLDRGVVMIMGPAPAGVSAARIAYYLTRLDGTMIDTIVRPAPPERDPAATAWSISRETGGKVQSVTVGIPGLPHDLVTWRSDGLRVSGNTGRYAITLQRGYGDTALVIESDAPQLLRTVAERDALFDANLAGQPEAWREAIRAVAERDRIPLERPRWSAMATDPEHRLWVGLPGPGADVTILEVFSPDGVLLGRVPAPHPDILDGYWTRDHVFLRDSDADGRPVIRVYRLDTTIAKEQ